MHIAIIGSRSSIHVVRWANALCKRGYKITVFTMHKPGEVFEPEVDVIPLPFKNPWGYLLNIPFLKTVMRDLAPDIVHSFYAFGHGFLGRTCSGEVPHVVSVLGSDIYDDVKNKLFRHITVQNILNAEVVCSTSRVMAEQIKKVCKSPVAVEITPFGIKTAQFDNEIKKKDDNEFVIGTVKWLEDKYGIDILIKAFNVFRNKYPSSQFKLIIVGTGSKMVEYRELVSDLKLNGECTFVGAVPHAEVPFWLSNFDVFAALSRLDSESFGVAILEASACRLPVVVSNAGGLPEVVDHLKTGIVVNKENIMQAATAFERLYNDKKWALKLGENGREKVCKWYEWDSSVNKMEKIYQRLVSLC